MEIGKARSTEEIIKDIKSTLETKVKDNVAVHGGEINFLSYEKGIVRLQMSKKTLQEGVERLLTHYVPEVIGLISEDDEEAKHKGYTPYFPKEMNV
jgi:Fe-S cluster biogenesis protein NfuA